MAERPAPAWSQIPLAEGRRRIEAAQDGRLRPGGRIAARAEERLLPVSRILGALALGLLAAGLAVFAVFVLLTLVFHFSVAP